MDIASLSLGAALLASISGLSVIGLNSQAVPVTGVDQETPANAQTDTSTTDAQSGERARFIVRFEGVEEAEKAQTLWFEDKAAARAGFAEWTSTEGALNGVSLDRATYSGELIFIWSAVSDPDRTVEKVQKDLLALKGVRYADLDELVTIEEERRQ